MTTAQCYRRSNRPQASKPWTKCSGTCSLEYTTSVSSPNSPPFLNDLQLRVCCLRDGERWLVTSAALPRSKGCWDAAGVICQSPDRRDRKLMDYLRPDRHKHDLWPPNEGHDPLGIHCYFTGIRIPKKLLKIPKILPVWPQITQTGTNTECFPNIPQTLQNKHRYQMEFALLLPADVFIKSNANKILLQLCNSTEKHLH